MIRQVNNEFREKDKETDVISSSMYEDLRHSAEEATALWFLSRLNNAPVARIKQKKVADIETELIELHVYGVLHLCGFDPRNKESEKEEMYRWERKIFELTKEIVA